MQKAGVYPPNFLIMWYVYILRSIADGEKYVGMTNDLRNRLQLHNQGKVFSTKSRKPFEPLYYEAHLNKFDAAAREKFLKTGWGKNWINKVLKNHLSTKKVGRTSSQN